MVTSSGNQMVVVRVSKDNPPADLLPRLGIDSQKPLIVVVGTSGEIPQPQRNSVYQLLSRGLVQAAIRMGATIFDTTGPGTLTELLGKAVADREHRSTLIGIALQPAGDPSGEPNLELEHSHYILLPALSPSEEQKMVAGLEIALARGVQALLVLVGGELEGKTKQLVLSGVRQRWPLLVLDGSGLLADKIAQLQRQKQKIEARQTLKGWKAIFWSARGWQKKAPDIGDPDLAEIVEEGKISAFPMNGRVEDLRGQVTKLLEAPQPPSSLELAWQTLATLNFNALRHQKDFKRLKSLPLALTVISTLLVLVQTWLLLHDRFQQGDSWSQVLRLLIIVGPILTAIFLALDTRLKSTNKWILMRGGAEAVKREIYSHRVLKYIQGGSARRRKHYTDQELARRIEDITSAMLQTEVNESALVPYPGPIPPIYGMNAADDGLSQLSTEQYVAVRLGDQLSYYSLKTGKLDKDLRKWQTWIILYGAMGTLLVATGAEFWLPLTAAIVAALTAYLEYQQTEQTLVKYNQTLNNLVNLKAWWVSLPDEEKKKSNNIFYLVEHTEQILGTEQSGWVREMQSTMQRQRERESELFSNAPNLVPDSKGNGAGQTVKGPATDEQSAPENN